MSCHNPASSLSLKSCLFLLYVCSAFLSFCTSISVTEIANVRPDLSETALFGSRSQVMESIRAAEYGSDLTVLFPSNDAWDKVTDEMKSYLLDPENIGDLEMLLLFCTTDSRITRKDVYRGMDPLITLLGVEATVDADLNEICVISQSGYPYSCANVVSWDIEVDEGIVHIIDVVLLPEELIELFDTPGVLDKYREVKTDRSYEDNVYRPAAESVWRRILREQNRQLNLDAEEWIE